ncbi:MAG: hypothetical protein WCJ25_03260 [Candidatus Moraniibacteriota bacterium]
MAVTSIFTDLAIVPGVSVADTACRALFVLTLVTVSVYLGLGIGNRIQGKSAYVRYLRLFITLVATYFFVAAYLIIFMIVRSP